MQAEQLQVRLQKITNAGLLADAMALMEAAFNAGKLDAQLDPTVETITLEVAKTVNECVQDLFEEIHDVGHLSLDSTRIVEPNEDGAGYTVYVEDGYLSSIKHWDHQQLIAELTTLVQGE